MHVQSCCFAYSTYCCFDVPVVVAVVVSKVPIDVTVIRSGFSSY